MVAMARNTFQFFLVALFATLLSPSAYAADCSADPNACTPAQLCKRSTEAISGQLYWIADPTDPYLSLARRFNLDCGAEDALQVETGGEGPQATTSETHQQSLSQIAGELLGQVDMKTKLDMPVMAMMQEYPACPETRPFDNCFAEEERFSGEGGQNPFEIFEFGIWKDNKLWSGFFFEQGTYKGYYFEGTIFTESCSQAPGAKAWNDWYYCPDGDTLRALEALDGQPDGRGRLESVEVKEPDGGTVRQNLRFGRWETRYASGNVYKGDVVNDQLHGRGTLTWADGEVYEGDFVNGQRTGRGTYTWADGDVYEGDFVNGQLNGQGTNTFADGEVWKGRWLDGEYLGP